MSAESILVASYAGPSNIIKGNSAWNKVMGPHKKSSKTCTNQIPEYKEYWRCRSNSDVNACECEHKFTCIHS